MRRRTGSGDNGEAPFFSFWLRLEPVEAELEHDRCGIVPEVDKPVFGEMLRGLRRSQTNTIILICCNSDDSADKDKKALHVEGAQSERAALLHRRLIIQIREQQREINKLFGKI